ncbi:C-C motif chemokine 21-like [Mantella aurantiaca]
MRGSRIPFLTLAALLYSVTFTQGTANTVADCCLQTSNKKIPAHVVTGYEIQTPAKGCLKIAVVFFTNTKPSRKLCSPLGSQWVAKLIRKLDKKKDLENKNRADRKPKKTPQQERE